MRTEKPALQREAKISGLHLEGLPSLEQIEHRRFELRMVSTLVLVGFAGSFVGLSLWSPSSLHAWLTKPGIRYGALTLTIAICAYLIEKELSLRRLSLLLFDERMLTTALTNRLHEIRSLLDAGRAVNSALELDQVLQAILRGATELLPAATGSVMLLDDGMLQVVAAVGNTNALGTRQQLGQGIAGHVAQTGAPLLINGPATGLRFPGLVSKHVAVASALSVPLVERGRLVGVLNVSADGDRRFTEYDLRAVNLFAEHAAAAIAKARLYEETRRQATELAHAATHDPLTGLANRIALAASMQVLPPLTSRPPTAPRGHEDKNDHIERRFGSALLFIDLDGFKQVNDTYGHHVGDALLVAVAGRIAHHLAGGDVAARLGGDEFAVLAHGVAGPEIALTIAQRVLAGLTPPVTVDGVTVSITASIGISLAPADDRDLDSMLRQADRALYAAKAAGKSCCCLADPDQPDRWIVVGLTGTAVALPRQRSADPLSGAVTGPAER